ncbi:LPS translocon maturation chaperone LptM [Erwinia pyri]|uniref:LPS translocon maturation chaperone LptM n=1 Tax=Erwinia pyri TaxID=3062598 RepID=UPI003D18407E
MNKMICRMALVLAVASLAGCGLKGPLYFPPQEQPKQQTTDSSDQASSTDRSSVESTSTDQNSGTASGTSTNQSSATISSQNGTESGTSTTEAETPSAQ